MLIRRMKPLGFTLQEMADLLRIIDTLDTADASAEPVLRTELSGFIEEATRRRAKLLEQLAMADEFLDLLCAVGS